MCNFCNNSRSGCGCGCGCGSGCGSCRSALARAIDNLFASPCSGCGCGCNSDRSGCGSCGFDPGTFTDCGNTDRYYARQYGLVACGGDCSCCRCCH